MNFPVFDMHCDTALSLLGPDMTGTGRLLENSLHIDLNRAGILPGYAQCFACFTTQWDSLPGGISPDFHPARGPHNHSAKPSTKERYPRS